MKLAEHQAPQSSVIDPALFVLLSSSIQARSQGAALAVHYAEQNAREYAHISECSRRRRQSARIIFRNCPIICIRLSDDIKAALGVFSSATVGLFKNQGDHARERHPDHAGRVIHAPPKTEAELLFLGRNQASKNKFELIFSNGPHSYVFVALRFRSADGVDVCWIDTAFLLNDKSRRKKIRTRNMEPYKTPR